MLADLGRHPATAKHIATKLARHFIADEPPPALVDRLTKIFIETDGNLWEVAKTLLRADEAWLPEQAKASGRKWGGRVHRSAWCFSLVRASRYALALATLTEAPGPDAGLWGYALSGCSELANLDVVFL